MRPTATVAGLLEAATARLAAAGIDTPRVDAEWLMAGLLGARRGELALLLGQAPAAELVTRYAAVIERREHREPLQRILGWEGFRGLRLQLSPDVLVPRPETEMVVDLVLGLLPPPRAERRSVVVDVGTGSGCIACAIATERPDVEVVAVDSALGALQIARDNARGLNLSHVRAVADDLLTAIGSRTADLIVSNPPYLPTSLLPTLAPEVRDHEPRGALDGGHDGLRVVGRLIGDARRVLRPGGALVLETAGGEQPAAVMGRLRDAHFDQVRVHRDLAGVERFVCARTSPSRGGA
jgi:release factor glutamine methyltransferase